jgi:hypothetical protein
MKYKEFNGGLTNDIESEINEWLSTVGSITIVHTETTFHDKIGYVNASGWKTVHLWYTQN